MDNYSPRTVYCELVINGDYKGIYILMEKIIPQIHPAILIVNDKIQELSCISEIGRYGVCIAENGLIIRNQDVAYLVRTKSEKIKEGGVCAGFACLNSLISV